MKLFIRITLSLLLIATLSSAGCQSKKKCAAYQSVELEQPAK
ncbi:MAG: hypothetical protein P8L71_05350 [Flavobacteriales bacterium]|nr:hypothetical protein [Flavobacteriales bacterium]